MIDGGVGSAEPRSRRRLDGAGEAEVAASPPPEQASGGGVGFAGAGAGNAEPWEVFARQDANIPIRHIGRVDASTLDDAIVFAYTLYEEWKWTDMFIVPRREIDQLVKPA